MKIHINGEVRAKLLAFIESTSTQASATQIVYTAIEQLIQDEQGALVTVEEKYNGSDKAVPTDKHYS